MNNQVKTENMPSYFQSENMMGPNSMIIIEELLHHIPLKNGLKVLDLGCGKGLTSIFLAKEYGGQVFAVDLWISATDNLKRFQQTNTENSIIPIYSDALSMPFANEYFDAVISVDAYHYFGNNDHYFEETLRPLLKKEALVALAFPGLKYEIHGAIPIEMKPLWEEEALPMWQSIEWWKPKFERFLSDFTIKEMGCFDRAWSDWLSLDNPYAKGDRKMIATDNGRYMNLISVTGRVI